MTSTSRRSPIRIRTSDPDRRSGAAGALALAAFLILASSPRSAQAQVRYEGQVYAMAYAWEAPVDDGGRFDTYEGFRLRVRPGDALDFRTHVLFAQREGADDGDVRVYNLYADARLLRNAMTARLGRQFLYRGTINGTFDGLSLRYRPADGWDVQALAGFAAPYSRELDFSTVDDDASLWDERGALGLFVSKQLGTSVKANASYFSRTRGGDVAWSLAGAAVSAELMPGLFAQSELEYNLETEAVDPLRAAWWKDALQRLRVRGWYETGAWILSAEASTQRPRIFEDSWFARFDFEGYQQLRAGASYDLGPARVGYEFVGTAFAEDETSGEHIATVGMDRGRLSGLLGFVYQAGYGGERVSPYVNARFDVMDGVELRGNFTYLEYQRRSIALDEESTAWSVGVLVRPMQRWWVQLDLQQSANTFYDQDTRVLARAGVTF